MDKWVLVADTEICDLSKKQVEICKNSDVKLQGVILCNKKENDQAPICQNVPFFPTFCHTDSDICIPGIRETKDEIENLAVILKEELEKQGKKI